METSRNILFVDDDPAIIAGFQRNLRKQFNIKTASNGNEAVQLLNSQEKFSVIVADMHMPDMNGIQLLQLAKEKSPETVRVMLTGAHDQETAISAINSGQIFRFLTKPCHLDLVTRVLSDAIEQHRLITAEKDLLEQTLHGAIRLLTDILAFVDPDSFGRLERLRGDVRRLCSALKVDHPWEVEIAAMLSPIGRMALPPEILQRANSTATLDPVEQDLFVRIPETGSMLLANIPRLENISAIVLYQDKRYDGGGFPPDSVAGERIPLGARIIHFLRDLDSLENDGMNRGQAIGQLAHDSGGYDPTIVQLAAQYLPGRSGSIEKPVREISINELKAGYILRRELHNIEGIVLLGIGQVITPALIERISNYIKTGNIKEKALIEDAS